MITKKYLLNRIEEIEKKIRTLQDAEPQFEVEQRLYYPNTPFAYIPKKSMAFVLRSVLDYLGLEFHHQTEKYELTKKGETP